MSSSQRKLTRGAEQVKALQAEAEAFANSQAYVFHTERERRGPNELSFRNYATQRVALPDHWPLLAGEAIQNIRSALDHAVWTAWKGVKENTGDGDHIQFPICDTPRKWKDAKWHLRGVPAGVRATVKRAQPYNRWPERPTGAPIAVLRDMSNADKHRTLAIVLGVITFEMAGVESPEVKIKDWNYASGKRLGDGTTEVSSFIVYSTTGEIADVDVEPQFTYGVAIENVGPDTLKMFVHEVFELVTEIETGFPPHPFAAYPL